jgi:hypothetical protein
MQTEAERIIYRILEATWRAKIIFICLLIHKIPRVAPYVRSFNLEGSDVGNRVLLNTFNLISSTLEKLSGLQRFRIGFPFMSLRGPGSTNYCAWLLRKCKFQLQSFECFLWLDQDLVDFLSKQHELRRIRFNQWVDVRGAITIPRIFLPKLEIIHCPTRRCDLAYELVSGRPVTHFNANFIYPHLIHNLALSTGQVGSRIVPIKQRKSRSIGNANTHLNTELFQNANNAPLGLRPQTPISLQHFNCILLRLAHQYTRSRVISIASIVTCNDFNSPLDLLLHSSLMSERYLAR